MKKVLFVCLIAASFTACNSGTATESTKDSTVTSTKDSVTAVTPMVVADSTKKDSVIVKKDSVTVSVKKDSTKKK